MSVRLTELHLADVDECLLINEELEGFGGARLDGDMQGRILSSVMGKAGFDMKEKTTAKKKRRINKRIVTIAAAAVLMSLGAIGVGAYHEGYRFEDGRFIKLEDSEIINAFGGENAEEWLESHGLNGEMTGGNEHYDISMHSLVSDGNFCQAYFCIEALDDEAMENLDCIWGPKIKAYYADTGEEINMDGSGWDSDPALNDVTHCYFSLKLSLMNADTSRDIMIHIIPSFSKDAESLADGLWFVFNASANVESKIIADAEGNELLLSPIGVSQKYETREPNPIPIKDLKLIKSDGSYVELADSWSGFSTGGSSIVWSLDFGSIIDISDIDGIVINNSRFFIDVRKDRETVLGGQSVTEK